MMYYDNLTIFLFAYPRFRLFFLLFTDEVQFRSINNATTLNKLFLLGFFYIKTKPFKIEILFLNVFSKGLYEM